MSDQDNRTTGGVGGGATNPDVRSGAAATPSSATAGNAGGTTGSGASTRSYTDPYAAGVTGADTSRLGSGSSSRSGGRSSESIAAEARERGRQAYEQGAHAYEDSVSWARDRYSRGAEWVSDTYEDATRYSKRGYRKTSEFIEENPLMVGVIGLAAGLAIGALLPLTRRENQYFGPWRDEVRDRGYRYGRDAVDRARHIAEEGYRAGYEEARRRGMTPSQMAENARDVARASREGAADTASKEMGNDTGSGNETGSANNMGTGNNNPSSTGGSRTT